MATALTAPIRVRANFIAKRKKCGFYFTNNRNFDSLNRVWTLRMDVNVIMIQLS